MDGKKSLDLAHKVMDGIVKRGIKDCKVSIYEQENSKLCWRDGRLEETSGAGIRNLSVGLYKEGRMAWQTTSDLRQKEIETFLDSAAAFVDLIPPDEWRSLPDPALQGLTEADLEIDEPDFARRSPETRRQQIQEMYELCRAGDSRVVEAEGWSYEHQELVTECYSGGFGFQTPSSYLDLGCMSTLLCEDGTRPSDGYATPGHLARQLGKPSEIAKETIKRTLEQAGQAKIESGTYDIVLRNENAGWPIWPLVQGISAWALDQKSTIYDGKKGLPITSALLSLREDPFIKAGFRSRHCDGEGFPAKCRDLVREGVLQDYLVDWYYSRKLGMKPNSGGISNLVVEPGSLSLQEMLAGVSKGIYVTGFNGGNDNPVTGDFSIGISGFLIKDGKLDRPVNEMLVSGNFKDLWNSLDALGNDVFTRSSILSPSMRFRDIKVAGL